MMDRAASQFSGGKIPPERLAQTKHENYWDTESAKIQYHYPLQTKNQEIILATGKQLANGIPDDQLYMSGPFMCCTSPSSHIGPYRWAIDFLVSDGSEVLAAQDGVIIESVDSFEKWGDDPKLASEMNLITIQHGKNNIEFSQYCHLKKRSLQVKIGDQVKVGQIIARVGKVGYTDRDHLHFIVFRNDLGGPSGFKSLRVEKFV